MIRATSCADFEICNIYECILSPISHSLSLITANKNDEFYAILIFIDAVTHIWGHG